MEGTFEVQQIGAAYSGFLLALMKLAGTIKGMLL